MVKGLYTAYTGMVIEQKRLDVLSNNLANADTNGFKKEGTTATSFADQLAIKIKDTSVYGQPQGLGDITFGAKLGETYTDWSQGNFTVSDSPYDFAIEGNGFFAISYTDKAGETSVKYTRDGAFTVNTDGYLVTKDGDFVLNANGAAASDSNARIRINPNVDFDVDEFGNITQNNQVVGRLGVIDVEDYNYLQEFGENMYDLAEGGTLAASTAKISQGTIEKSNVNIISEMVDMITITRAYESNQKIIQSIDDSLGIASKQVGKV